MAIPVMFLNELPDSKLTCANWYNVTFFSECLLALDVATQGAKHHCKDLASCFYID